MFQRSWVQILAQYTGWNFFTLISCKICHDVCLKRPKINHKRGQCWPIFFKNRGMVRFRKVSYVNNNFPILCILW